MEYGKHRGGAAPERTPAAFLRLDASGVMDGRVEVPLFSAADGDGPTRTLDVFPGSVYQSKKYHVDLLAAAGALPDFASVAISVNGKEEHYARRSSMCSTLLKDGEVMHGYALTSGAKDDRPFALICGYARMRVTLFDAEGTCVGAYFAKDVACRQDDPVNAKAVEEMMAALSCDPRGDRVLGWMAGDAIAAKNAPYSLMEGGMARNARRSVDAYLAIIEDGLSAMEAALPYIRSHAAGRVQHREVIVDAGQVRRAGAPEMRWLSTHLDELRPARLGSGVVTAGGRSLAPARMASVKAVRSLDVYENQLCLSYLHAVAASLRDFEAKVRRGQDFVSPFRASGASSGEASHVFSASAARMLQGRQRQRCERAERLRQRALRLKSLYRKILPGVSVRPLGETRVMRTKIFKEIRAYSQVYRHIERFCQFGENVPDEGGLAIESLRLDRAYETYVLYRMLDWLRARGFDLADEGSACAVRYGYTSDVFSDEPHVNNVYYLVKGDISVSVFYEPVLFHTGARIPGMALCRMRNEGVYTPDFVVTAEFVGEAGQRVRRTFVLDAKYRPRRNVLSSFSCDKKPEYEQRVSMYLFNTIDRETLQIPDAMWLLCGLEDAAPQVLEVEAAPWMTFRKGHVPSGVALLTPQTDMTPIFAALGLVPEYDGEGYVRASALSREDAVMLGLEQAREEAACDCAASSPSDAPAAGALVEAATAEDVSASDATTEDAPAPDASIVSAETLAPSAVEAAAPPAEDASADASVASSAPDAPAAPSASALPDGVEDSDDASAVDRARAEASKKSRARSARRKEVAEEAARQREAARAKAAKKEEKARRRREEREAAEKQASMQQPDVAPSSQAASASPASAARSDSDVERLVLDIVDALLADDVEALFDAKQCRRKLGLSQPLLKRKAAKGYLPLEGREGVYFFCSKLPTCRRAIERYRDKVAGS